MIESGIHQLLLADPTVTAVAANRIYPILLPDSTTQVSATYRLISSVPQYTNDGPTGWVRARLQIDTWSATYGDCKTLASAIAAVLDGYSGVSPDGQTIYSIMQDSAGDGFDPDARLYWAQTDWIILYDSTIATAPYEAMATQVVTQAGGVATIDLSSLPQNGIVQITLAGDVTSSSFSGGKAGQQFTLFVTQPATGPSHSFAMPANAVNAGTIDGSSGPGSTSYQTFAYVDTLGRYFAVGALLTT